MKADDVESDIYAQDTWKNDWRKSEKILNKYFDGDLNYLEEIMDHVTSDSYKYETGNDYFWDKHANIINDNFYGDWNWLEAIQYWDEKDIDQAKREWSNDLQKNQNVKPGNSSFDDRRRTTEAEDDMNYDISQADTRVALDWASIDGRLYDDILQAFVDEHGEGYYDDWVITANKEGGVEENLVEVEAVTEEITREAAGEFAQPLYTLQDDLGLEDNILVDELAHWLDAQDITDFVENFRRHHDMNHPGEDGDYGEDDKNFEATEEAEEITRLKHLINFRT